MLSVLQRNGALPGSEIARRTGLSQQTVSVILRKLEEDALVLRQKPVRGRVGKPTVPIALNPDGLFSIGLKIGRRSADLLLIDIAGQVRHDLHLTYDYPQPQAVFDFLGDGLATVLSAMRPRDRARVCGVGIAAPFELWHWHDVLGAPAESFLAWRGLDFAEQAAQVSDLPIHVVNDATAACRAEHVFGRGREFRDYAYFFVGAFVGGGVVLDHSVIEGRQGNAGALGLLPSPAPGAEARKLIDVASLHMLETRLSDAGVAHPQTVLGQPDWSGLSTHVDPWLDETAQALAQASLTACAVFDFEAVIVDGAVPPDIRAKLVARMRAALAELDQRGLIAPRIQAGTIGADSRAIGAASSAFIAEVLFDKSASQL